MNSNGPANVDGGLRFILAACLAYLFSFTMQSYKCNTHKKKQNRFDQLVAVKLATLLQKKRNENNINEAYARARMNWLSASYAHSTHTYVQCRMSFNLNALHLRDRARFQSKNIKWACINTCLYAVFIAPNAFYTDRCIEHNFVLCVFLWDLCVSPFSLMYIYYLCYWCWVAVCSGFTTNISLHFVCLCTFYVQLTFNWSIQMFCRFLCLHQP